MCVYTYFSLYVCACVYVCVSAYEKGLKLSGHLFYYGKFIDFLIDNLW